MRWRDHFYYMVGLCFLGLAKAKHVLHGYTTPKPFDVSDVDRCIEYDLEVVAAWLEHLRRYAGEGVEGKDVLELGPGSDIGTGIALLARGCSTYNACDVNDLAAAAPDAFYERLLERLGGTDCAADRADLAREVEAARKGMSSRLRYVVRDDFDLADTFGRASIDLVVSQAAFEHFDDVESTVAQLDEVCRPGAIIVAEIDLMTHTRWIRDKDPNNIYRYSPRIYDLFYFRGRPNRVRPFQYQEAFERRGWKNVTITPLQTTQGRESLTSGLYEKFLDERNRMDILTFVLTATKSGVRAARSADARDRADTVAPENPVALEEAAAVASDRRRTS